MFRWGICIFGSGGPREALRDASSSRPACAFSQRVFGYRPVEGGFDVRVSWRSVQLREEELSEIECELGREEED